MKVKILLSILCALIISIAITETASAQVKVKRVKYNNTFTGDPLGLMFGYGSLTYEKALKNNNTMTAGFTYGGYNGWSGFNLSGSYRWYFLTTNKYKPNEGLSAGPMLLLGYWDADTDKSDGNKPGFGLSLGAEIAYKLVIEKGFTVEPIIKIHYPVLPFGDLNIVNSTKSQYKPFVLGINFGYSWP